MSLGQIKEAFAHVTDLFLKRVDHFFSEKDIHLHFEIALNKEGVDWKFLHQEYPHMAKMLRKTMSTNDKGDRPPFDVVILNRNYYRIINGFNRSEEKGIENHCFNVNGEVPKFKKAFESGKMLDAAIEFKYFRYGVECKNSKQKGFTEGKIKELKWDFVKLKNAIPLCQPE
jgi:hypothetical protein